MAGAGGFEIEGDAETFLGRGEVEEGGPDDALGSGEGVIERKETTFEAAKEVSLLMEGSNAGCASASGMLSIAYGSSRRSIKRREPEGSSQGTTRTGSSAEHSADQSKSMCL